LERGLSNEDSVRTLVVVLLVDAFFVFGCGMEL